MDFDRESLILKLANKATDSVDMSELLDYFREGQVSFLQNMSDEDLINYATDFLGYNPIND